MNDDFDGVDVLLGRTRRDTKKHNKKNKDKELIRLYHKYNRLWNAKRTHTWVDLPKPVRYGWQRFFVLRDDIAKSRDADFYRGILKHIQNNIVSIKKDFTYRDWKSKKRMPIKQGLKDISHKEWNKIGFTAKQQALFEKVWRPNRDFYGKDLGTGEWMFEFKKPWMFVLKVQPFYITKQLVLDPQLESQIAEIHNKINNANLWPKIYKARSRSYDWKDWEDRRAKMEMKAIFRDQNIDLYYDDASEEPIWIED